MKINKVLITATVFLFSFASLSFAKDKGEDNPIVAPDTTLIDIPTSGILDYYGFLFTTRFFSEGGVVGALDFGVMERLNLGASMSVERLIGSGSSIKMLKPEIQAKFRFYDGGYYLPSFALGFDGQGYFYDRAREEYMQEGRGVYVTGSKEALIPDLVLHGGLNVPDFNDSYIFAFLAANYMLEDKISFIMEFDNLLHNADTSRFNLGTRFYLTPYFHLDIAFRDIGASGNFSSGTKRKTERIVQLRYNTSF